MGYGSRLVAAGVPFGAAKVEEVAAGWTLIPEPTTALSLTLGLAGLGVRRRH